LQKLDILTGHLASTGLKVGGLVRYSADGKFVACRSDNSGIKEELTILSVADNLSRRNFGQFTRITSVRPTDDGAFLVTADNGQHRYDKNAHMIGVQIRPDTGQLRELWKLPFKERQFFETECYHYAQQAQIGVATDFRLVTTVVDLPTGNVVFVIDNSANEIPGLYWSGLLIGLGSLVATWLLGCAMRRRRAGFAVAVNAFASIAAIIGPFLVLHIYMQCIANQSPVNDWAFLSLSIVVGLVGFLDIRSIPLWLRVRLCPVYGCVMFFVVLWSAVALNPAFTEQFTLV
jgi:hypothetical protein